MKLKELRVKAGYSTQKALAQAMGIKQTRLNMWENGNSKPGDLLLLSEYSKFLGVSIEVLLNCFKQEAKQ